MLLTAVLALAGLTGSWAAETADSNSGLKCVGILCIRDLKLALIERGSSGNRSSNRTYILAEGQREDAAEVVAIKPEQAIVTVRADGTNTSNLALTNVTTVPNPGLALENADAEPVLALYQALKKTTLLRHPAVPRMSFTLRAALATDKKQESTASPNSTNYPPERAAAAEAIEKAISEKGVVVVPDGERFSLLVSKDKTAQALPGATEAAAANRWALRPENINPGLVDFRGTDLSQVLNIYALLTHRVFVPRVNVPGGTIDLRSGTSLTSLEVTYALDRLLAWRGIKMVPIGSDHLGMVLEKQ